jgi:hypothetical protein
MGVTPNRTRSAGFSLKELLSCLALVAILGALMLAFSRTGKERARRTVCLSNLRQMTLLMNLFIHEHGDQAPTFSPPSNGRPGWYQYKALIDVDAEPAFSAYVGSMASPTNNRTFHCPSDRFFFDGAAFQTNGFKDQIWTGFSSYAFNGENTRINPVKRRPFPGIAGERLSDIANPAKTLLMLEAAARAPYSWHNPRRRRSDYRQNNSRNALGYVDGHADYLKIFWKGPSSEAWQYNPPPEYRYRWDAK